MMTRSMTRIAELEARIAELEKKNEVVDDSICQACYDKSKDGCVYCYYICRHCFAFGTEDPDCTKCGKKSCVLLYNEPNSSMALEKAKSKNE